jgi:hypothetical protein
MVRFIVAGLWLFIPLWFLAAQEDGDFGFGFEDEPDSARTASGPRVQVSGEVAAQILGFGDDFSSEERFKKASVGDIFSGKLNFAASAFNADGVINLKLAPVWDGSSPVSIDEAYLRVYFGKLDVEGGLRKLTWGKADSFGPLDVVNPLDYSDLSTMTDLAGIKLARPLLHLSYSLGAFSKLEGVFIPGFAGHHFAQDGRWAPAQVTGYAEMIESRIMKGIASLAPLLLSPPPGTHQDLTDPTGAGIQKIRAYYADMDMPSLYPPTSGLEYAQAGLRFTTTVGSSDLGIQYFFGNLFRPAVTITGEAQFLQDPYGIRPDIRYNRYHQIGADYAQVIAGFNLRAELAANITSDLSGDDGQVYNPAIAWSLGFDRDLFWGINLNCQGTESIRLLSVGDDPALDTEAGTDMSSTRIILTLSRKFLRDELELKTTGIWDIEDKGFYILPALIWTKGDVEAELSGGIFGGDEQGELGQYRKNGFIKVVLTYSF